jgi:putative FmdB family regulatory protein
MPLYEYECENCGHVFELRHGMNEETVTQCPECHGKTSQKISGGTGFIIKGSGGGNAGNRSGSCSFETSGRTCCGRDQRCEKPPCES